MAFGVAMVVVIAQASAAATGRGAGSPSSKRQSREQRSWCSQRFPFSRQLLYAGLDSADRGRAANQRTRADPGSHCDQSDQRHLKGFTVRSPDHDPNPSPDAEPRPKHRSRP